MWKLSRGISRLPIRYNIRGILFLIMLCFMVAPFINDLFAVFDPTNRRQTFNYICSPINEFTSLSITLLPFQICQKNVSHDLILIVPFVLQKTL